jgi:glycosyltransferase involved in cell wall biosynthesis
MTENSTAQQMRPWVTFCMTTYKRPEFLAKQLKSILKQSVTDFSIIVSDNDVEASAKKVIEEIGDPRIEYHVNEANLGMVKSFNSSLSKATSEYVVMITDDDPVYPEMLETLRDLSLQYPGYGMYYGGCDIVCYNPDVAFTSRLRVGTNSCLANLPIGTVRTYTGQQFPFAYFKGEIGGHILWSTGIVRRDVALAIDGMPDFGAPYNTDFGYIVLSGAQKGAVLINTSLGAQVVHGTNYGFTESEYQRLFVTPQGFYKWVMDRLPKENNYQGIERHIELFIARWVVEYAASIHKMFKMKGGDRSNFNKYVDQVFKIPYLRKWKYKYLLATRFPRLFEIAVGIKAQLAGLR